MWTFWIASKCCPCLSTSVLERVLQHTELIKSLYCSTLINDYPLPIGWDPNPFLWQSRLLIIWPLSIWPFSSLGLSTFNFMIYQYWILHVLQQASPFNICIFSYPVSSSGNVLLTHAHLANPICYLSLSEVTVSSVKTSLTPFQSFTCCYKVIFHAYPFTIIQIAFVKCLKIVRPLIRFFTYLYLIPTSAYNVDTIGPIIQMMRLKFRVIE